MTERDGGDHERELGAVFDETGPATEQTPSSAGDSSATPDLSAIQADDALLDALGGSDPQLADGLGDQELNALLLAWRRDIDSEPIAELADTETAVITIKTATLAKRHGGRGRRRRMLVPVAAAAAVLAIGFTGTALAARDAQPGDTLWGVSKVLYSDHARSVEAAASVRTELQEASLAIAQQRYDDARKALEDAQNALGNVTTEEELSRLRARHTELMAQLNTPPGTGEQQTSATAPGGSSSPTDSGPTGTPPTSQPQIPPSQLDPTTSASPTTPPTTSTSAPSTSTSSDSSTGTESDGSNSRHGASVVDPEVSPEG
ncbi:anti-sigma-D factor RsdA [Qaidamihabitans albus]|uniref:anti-sigma-D factor RsdA n=1 Tax=Qaidamihabitans albus TaxID=2795733 RepID=UPI0018F12962|nr:anti-sigma-D factor RsdA [Qaidamihabitans albus]